MEDYKLVIEEKRHDNSNTKKKVACVGTHDLTLKFNLEASVTKRTSRQLIHLWRDLKGKAKKETRATTARDRELEEELMFFISPPPSLSAAVLEIFLEKVLSIWLSHADWWLARTLRAPTADTA